MDLSAYTLQKLNREKRERQPNWTESEKQLLLTLTRMHQAILENKGSDTMTIKRKSLAWDEIATRMQAAGFNRSKERLKQQLGRIRAAEAKRIKDALERNLCEEQVKTSSKVLFNNLIKKENINFPMNSPQYNREIQQYATTTNPLKITELLPLSEDKLIKTENSPSADENEYSEEELPIKAHGDNMHFMVQNVQSLAEVHCNVNTHNNTNANASDVTSTVVCPINSPKMNNPKEMPLNTGSGNEEEENNTSGGSNALNQQENNRPNFRCLKRRKRRIRKTLTRDESLRQLYMYRIAVERERLHNLKLQQKRDRILYRKDVEIQNLKLQILQNLTNQNREPNNRINL